MKYAAIYLLVASAIPSPAQVVAAGEVVRAGVSFDIPLAYSTPDGEAAGFFVDVFREAARAEGIHLQVIVGRTAPDVFLESGAGDIWIAAVETPERQRKFHVTRPWWILETYLAVLQSSGADGSRSMAGKRVLYSPSPPFSRPLAAFLPGATAVVESNLQARFDALCNKRADGVLFHETDVPRLLSGSEYQACKPDIRILPIDPPVRQLSMLARRTHAEIADRLRERIEQMKREGSIERLPSFRVTGNELWRSQLDEQRKLSTQRLWQVGLLCAALLAAGALIAYVRLRAAHEQVRRSLDTAQEAARAKQEFLATMSHEIRTPVTAVLGAAELLSHCNLDGAQREYAEAIHRSARSLLTLLNDVIDWSRIESGRFAVDQAAFEMGQLLEDVKANVLLAARAKGIALQIQGLQGSYEGDPGAIRQVLLNFVSNAVKFTDQGTVSVRVQEMSREGKTARVRAEVLDTGVGISEQAKKTLFQRFNRGDVPAFRSYEGSGLGLAISKELVERMGGVIGFESRSGHGSKFWFEVPLLVADAYETQNRDGVEAEAMPRLSILVVEDNEINGLLIRRLLTRLGHDVESAADGLQALERLEAGRFDLVFMDCLMPGMDGFDATLALRKRGLKTPVVALTASALDADRRRCFEVGMDGFLTKPVLLSDLARAIRQYGLAAREQG